MNVENLRIFVEALNNLPDEVKNGYVDMESTKNPAKDGCGCHAGLVSIVAEKIPELKKLYYDKNIYHNHYKNTTKDYYYSQWSCALADYLGFRFDNSKLKLWAKENFRIWGNEDGHLMFQNGKAFGKTDNFFKNQVIINQWTKVLERIDGENNEYNNTI